MTFEEGRLFVEDKSYGYEQRSHAYRQRKVLNRCGEKITLLDTSYDERFRTLEFVVDEIALEVGDTEVRSNKYSSLRSFCGKATLMNGRLGIIGDGDSPKSNQVTFGVTAAGGGIVAQSGVLLSILVTPHRRRNEVGGV